MEHHLPPHPTLGWHYEADEERQRFVNDMFDRASRHYDWINRVMSFGSGYWYRGEVLRHAGLASGMRVLDVATGTGPVAAVAADIVGPTGLVIAVDPSSGMLHEASRHRNVHLVQAVGEKLSLRNESFDMLTMGYALRHLPDLHTAFVEYRRVLKPGGRVVIMEVTMPSSRIGSAMLRVYMGSVLPLVARVGTRSRDAEQMMRYYWDTTRHCVPPDAILGELRRAGFNDVRRDLHYGMLSEYHAAK